MKTIQKFINSGKIISKEYKTDVLNKYDKNKDKFITIDEYLDKELNLGPNEKSYKTSYNYQNLHNIYNYFFLIKLKEVNKYKVLCLPNFIINDINLDGTVYKLRNTILVNIYYNYYIIPKNLKELIEKCRNNKNHILIYLTCGISFGKDIDKKRHTNMVIINLQKNTIERFEPHGNCKRISDINNKVNILFKKMLKDIDLKFKYISPIELSNKIGIQEVADSYSGMCTTISMLYLQMRLINLDKKQRDIINYFLKKDKKKLKDLILRFAKYIKNKLEKYYIEINNLNNELIY
tara:strand:- start:10100 stop:10975 length:876 start_codon:yes stop_codon:yes gene_type:complete